MQITCLSEINEKLISSDIEFRTMLSEIKYASTKNGSKYATLIFQDKTKACEGKLWECEQVLNEIGELNRSQIVDIVATVGEYQNKIQLTVKSIQIVNEVTDLSNFIPSSSWNYDKMQTILMEYYDKVTHQHIKKLLDKMIFSDEYYNDFCEYPAAKTVHHNFYHGLLQHVLEILNYSLVVAKIKRLSSIQTDRMIAIAMLHDWAKIIEYKRLPEFGITTKGSMMGHIFLGAHHTLSEIEKIEEFPEEDMIVIINGILGHHGCLEWGSPVLPKSVEAQIVHEADKMSGDIESILSHIEENKDKGDKMTGKLWNMGTEYFLG